MTDTKYSIFLYQGDKTKAFSVGFYTMDNKESYTREEVDYTVKEILLEVLEALKHTYTIDDYDIGKKVNTWKALK